MQAVALDVGQRAPDFTLKGPGGQPVTLSEYRGKKFVVLVFFPLAFSPVCSNQLPELDRQRAELEKLDAVVLGISVDSHHANTAFARQLGIDFPLLSDFQKTTSAAYGVLDVERGTSRRSIFVVDRDGIVVHKDVSPAAGEMSPIPSASAVVDTIRSLS
jgi:peroxiredoxin